MFDHVIQTRMKDKSKIQYMIKITLAKEKFVTEDRLIKFVENISACINKTTKLNAPKVTDDEVVLSEELDRMINNEHVGYNSQRSQFNLTNDGVSSIIQPSYKNLKKEFTDEVIGVVDFLSHYGEDIFSEIYSMPLESNIDYDNVIGEYPRTQVRAAKILDQYGPLRSENLHRMLLCTYSAFQAVLRGLNDNGWIQDAEDRYAHPRKIRYTFPKDKDINEI